MELISYEGKQPLHKTHAFPTPYLSTCMQQLLEGKYTECPNPQITENHDSA